MTNPDVSVVLCVFNGAETLPEQLNALAGQVDADRCEFLVIDNGSTDGSAEVAWSWSDRLPSLRVVRAHERQGLSFARNVGAREAMGRYLLFCDADDVVDARWVGESRAALEHYDMIGGAIDITRLNSLHVQYACPPMTPGRLPVGQDFLPYAQGANFGIKAEVYNAVGGCDESFVTCGDDIDLSWRVQLAGFSLGFAPKAIVNYRLRSDLRSLLRQQRAYGAAVVALRRKFRAHGVPPVPAHQRRFVLRALLHADHLIRSRGLRRQWLSELAFRSGIAAAHREIEGPAAGSATPG